MGLPVPSFSLIRPSLHHLVPFSSTLTYLKPQLDDHSMSGPTAFYNTPSYVRLLLSCSLLLRTGADSGAAPSSVYSFLQRINQRVRRTKLGLFPLSSYPN